MEGKRVVLSINPEFYRLVKSRAEKEYMNVQQYIYELLRKNVLISPVKKSNAGRPKKSGDLYMDMFTRNR